MYYILLEQANLGEVLEDHEGEPLSGFFSPSGEKIESLKELSSFNEVIFHFFNHYKLKVEVHTIASLREAKRFEQGWVFYPTFYYWDGDSMLGDKPPHRTPEGALATQRKGAECDNGLDFILFKYQQILE